MRARSSCSSTLATVAGVLSLALAMACSDDVSVANIDASDDAAHDLPDSRPDGDGDAGSGADTESDGGVDGECAAWNDAVNEHWGVAPVLETRLALFDELWRQMDENFPAFVTTPWVDWDEVRAIYRPQIEAAESYGRFYALAAEIMNSFQDVHTFIWSASICESPQTTERPPAFVRTDYPIKEGWLGACVTPLDDDRMLVYRVEPDNPAGLAPGDVILGYDGVPWRELAARLETCRLPVCGWWAARRAADSADDSMLMSSLVLNAHLFERLDVQRYGETEPESFATDELIGYTTAMECTDQLPVEGVEFPWTHYNEARNRGHDVSWGRLDGNIGYIYVYGWERGVEQSFTAAVEELMDTEGLIIDSRLNYGGNYLNIYPAVKLLFNEDLEDVLLLVDRRGDSTALDVVVDPNTYYDHPIALLTGPRSQSTGDTAPYVLSRHPRSRRFGRATSGDFVARWRFLPLANQDLLAAYPTLMLQDADGAFLHRSEQTPETPIWLTQEDVAAGRDTVVEAALAWIAEQNEK